MTNKLLALLLGLFIISCENKKESDKPLKIGDTIEISDYNLININQRQIDNDKLILLDFWATWCGPCIASFPHLEELQEKYSNNLQVLTISDEKADIVANFLEKKNINLSFLNDVEQKLFKRFNISHRPTSCLVSKKGEFLWIRSSKYFEQILIEYLKSGKIPEPAITEFNKEYYNQEPAIKQDLDNYNYILSEGKDPKLYFAKNQKNENELINIKYISVPITDVIMDFFQSDNLNFINNRPELDTILLNIEDIQNAYGFNIKTKDKNTDVYLLTIVDENALEKNIETIKGGGMVERKDEQHIITRLSLSQSASYFQNRLKIYIQYEGTNDSKYNFTFDNFKNLDELTFQLKKIGIKLSKHRKNIEYLEIN
jgi:thiol-disulfide isomerase/thioredoxin